MTDVVEQGRLQARVMLAAGSRSFALAGRLLPREIRDDAAVIYAYCRRADDLVDEVPLAQAEVAVQALERELEALYGGLPQSDPLLHAFQELIVRRQLPFEYPRDLLAGLAMDARPAPILYSTWEELDLYCYRVAGTVGLMMAHLMGVRAPATLAQADALGRAMQLTNICRDVAEDWARGRLYLPEEILPAGTPPLLPGQLDNGQLPLEARQALSSCLPRLLRVAEALYKEGDRGLVALDPRAARAMRAARLIYADIGQRLAARGHDVGAGRAIVSLPRKLWLVLCALVRPHPRLLSAQGASA